MSSPHSALAANSGQSHVEESMTHFEKIAEKRSIPGVLSFNATGELLYMNAEAELLNQQILTTESENGNSRFLPSEVLDICLDLQKVLQSQVNPKDCEKVEFRRVIGDVNLPILLRGFLLPDVDGQQGARLLILMERIGRQNRIIPAQTKERFHLTHREQEIVKYIADGRTNKEIAKDLSISEHTVKEHIRHLLRKTKSTTRTGVLAQIFRDS